MHTARWSSPAHTGCSLISLTCKCPLAPLTRCGIFALLAVYGGEGFLFPEEFSLCRKLVWNDPNFCRNILFIRWIVARSPRRAAVVFELGDTLSWIFL